MNLGQKIEVVILTMDSHMHCGGFNMSRDIRIKKCFKNRIRYRQRWLVEIIGILKKRLAPGIYHEIYLTKPIKCLRK